MIANDNLRIEQGDHVLCSSQIKSLLPTSKDSSSQAFLLVINKASNDALLFPFDYKD